MPRGRAGRSRGVGEWVQSLGEQIGQELGQAIAQSVRRELLRTIDPKDLARQLGAGDGRRGRRAGQKGVCTEAGCTNPVLAKGLCRSHYYRARYRAQKAGTLMVRSHKARAGDNGSS
jgi:hypothetical protein